MAITVSGVATTFNLVNYHGSLYTIRGNSNLFSGVVGALAEGQGRIERNYEFGINVETLPDPSQPAILEGDTIVSPSELAMSHQVNVTQIYNYSFGMTYSKTANPDRIGVIGSQDDIEHTANEPGAVADPFEHQLMLKLAKMRRDVNYTFLNGTYQRPTNPTSTARKSRGVIAAADGGNVIALAGAQLQKANIDLLLRMMLEDGAFDDGGETWIWVNAYLKQRMTQIYAVLPADRHLGGANIQQIETDFGVFPIAVDRDVPADTLLVANMSVIEPVYNLVRDPRAGTTKGIVFREPVPTSKTEFIDHIYAEIGLDHGPGLYHGKITGAAITED